MEKIIKKVVCITAIVSVYIIMYAGAGIDWLPHFYSDNEETIERANTILLNISYSYLAGYIFYLLTIALPHWYKTRKIAPVVKDLCKQIHGKFEDSIKALWPMATWNSIELTKDNVVNRLREVSVNSPCGYSDANINRSILSHLSGQKRNIDEIIVHLIAYQELLSTELITVLEDIRNSNYSYLLSAFRQIAIMDTPNNRIALAEELWRLYKKSAELLDY